MLVVRSLLFSFVFYVTLAVMLVLLLPLVVFGPEVVKAAARLWGRVSLFWLRVVCGLHVEFRGRENIPPGGIIVAAKHQSFWEVFALITVFENFIYVLKRELTYIPLFGWYLVRAGQIAINRSRGRQALTEITRKGRVVIGEGRQLFIFPEGTRRPPGAAPSYKFGVAHLYAELNVPCVPVALDSGLFWPRRSVLRRPGTIVVDILPPIPPGMAATAFLPLLQERIETATARLIAEAVERDPTLGAGLAPADPTAAGDPA